MLLFDFCLFLNRIFSCCQSEKISVIMLKWKVTSFNPQFNFLVYYLSLFIYLFMFFFFFFFCLSFIPSFFTFWLFFSWLNLLHFLLCIFLLLSTSFFLSPMPSLIFLFDNLILLFVHFSLNNSLLILSSLLGILYNISIRPFCLFSFPCDRHFRFYSNFLFDFSFTIYYIFRHTFFFF